MPIEGHLRERSWQEVVPMGEGKVSRRRSVRRAVAVDCALACDLWDGAVQHRGTDVSNEGLWIDTPFPLEQGEEVVLSFAPPGAGVEEEVWAIAEVARVGIWRRRHDLWPAGMGLAFTYLNSVDRRFLTRSLVGHPPRLPGRRRPPPLPTMREPIQLTRDDVRFLDEAETPFDGVPAVLDAELAEDLHITPLAELLTAGTTVAPAAHATRAPASWGIAATLLSLLR